MRGTIVDDMTYVKALSFDNFVNNETSLSPSLFTFSFPAFWFQLQEDDFCWGCCRNGVGTCCGSRGRLVTGLLLARDQACIQWKRQVVAMCP